MKNQRPSNATLFQYIEEMPVARYQAYARILDWANSAPENARRLFGGMQTLHALNGAFSKKCLEPGIDQGLVNAAYQILAIEMAFREKQQDIATGHLGNTIRRNDFYVDLMRVSSRLQDSYMHECVKARKLLTPREFLEVALSRYAKTEGVPDFSKKRHIAVVGNSEPYSGLVFNLELECSVVEDENSGLTESAFRRVPHNTALSETEAKPDGDHLGGLVGDDDFSWIHVGSDHILPVLYYFFHFERLGPTLKKLPPLGTIDQTVARGQEKN